MEGSVGVHCCLLRDLKGGWASYDNYMHLPMLLALALWRSGMARAPVASIFACCCVWSQLGQRAGCMVAAWTGGGGGSGGRRAAAAEGFGRCPKACTVRYRGIARTLTRALPHSLPCISENVLAIGFHA